MEFLPSPGKKFSLVSTLTAVKSGTEELAKLLSQPTFLTYLTYPTYLTYLPNLFKTRGTAPRGYNEMSSILAPLGGGGVAGSQPMNTATKYM